MISLYRPSKRAFSLMELMVVISIIAILATLLLNIAPYARDKSKRDRAQGEIAAIETALENYKADNGAYPTSSSSVPNVTFPNPKNGTVDYSSYNSAAEVLYQALSGKSSLTTPNTDQKSYMEFKTNQVDPTSQNFLIDPWLHPYGYSYAQSTNPNGPFYDADSKMSYNINFVDLWSTAGAKDGDQIVPSKLVSNWTR